jgi:hypothetical protein
LPPGQKLYVASVRAKFKQKTSLINPGTIDLKYVDVGKVFFVTTGDYTTGGTIQTCFGNNVGAYVCPEGEMQVVEGGFWSCVSVKDALAKACNGASQMLKTGTGGTANCSTFYKVSAGCEGAGATTTESTCKPRSCTTSTSQGGGSTPISIPAIPVAAQTVPGTTVTVTHPGSGTSPSTTSSYTVPAQTVPGFTIPGTTVYVPVPASVTVQTLWYDCNGSACNLGSPPSSCPNAPL